jgi:hypothetical protein
MANNENKSPKATETLKENREEIFVPKGYANDEPNFVIGINGVNYVLPKGKKSTVPDFVAAEFHRSQRAQEKLDDNIEQMLEASK